MTYFFKIILTSWIIICISGCKKEIAESEFPIKLNVISFNVRFDNPADNENNWKFRKEFIAETIRKHDVDIIGSQEMLFTQLKDFIELMPQYTYAGVGRKDGIMAGEYSAVFYKKDKLSYYNGGTFWLSENPSAVGVKGWDASLERIVTWVILKDKISGKKIAVFNTHFDHIGVLARKESARLLINKIDELSMGLPVIATGDLNSTPDSEALKTITDQSNPKHLTDTRSIANMIEGPGWTMHDFGKTAESQRRIIDYILVKNAIIAELHKTIFEMRGNLYLSDHNPVFAKLTVN